ncbi:MAG: ABC transporter permease [Chthoniobacteraceae bacterium]
MAELNAPTEIVIEPPRRWLRIDVRELWEYRDLLALMVRRDLLARYQQTLLGPLWHVVQPLLTMLMFVIVFARVAGIPTDGIPAPLFYLSGLLAWNYFAQNLQAAAGTFQNNHHLFTKVWFPRLVMPLAATVSNLIMLGLQAIPFVIFAAYYALAQGIAVGTWQLLLLPLAILHVAAVGLGVGLWMAAFTAKYRDLMHLNQFLVQLWMFATPIIYPLSKVPERWLWLAWLNPMSAPVETFRWCLLGRGHIEPLMLGISATFALLLVAGGLLAFQNAARSAVDTV